MIIKFMFFINLKNIKISIWILNQIIIENGFHGLHIKPNLTKKWFLLKIENRKI